MTTTPAAVVAAAKAEAAAIVAAPLPIPAASSGILAKLKAFLSGLKAPAWLSTALAKVKSMLLTLLAPLLSPALRIVGYALAALAVAGTIYVAGAVHDHKIMVAHEKAALAAQKKEADNAIAAATAAREAAEKKFDAGRYRAPAPSRLPGRLRPRATDGFARD